MNEDGPDPSTETCDGYHSWLDRIDQLLADCAEELASTTGENSPGPYMTLQIKGIRAMQETVSLLKREDPYQQRTAAHNAIANLEYAMRLLVLP